MGPTIQQAAEWCAPGIVSQAGNPVLAGAGGTRQASADGPRCSRTAG